MKRCITVCTGIMFMGMVFMFGTISSAQEKPVPAVPHHQAIESAQPGVFTPTTPPPTGAGEQYQGQPYSPQTIGEAKQPIETKALKQGLPAVPHHQAIEATQPGVFTPTTPPPTGAGKQYEGQPYSPQTIGELKEPIQPAK